jgi:hypothetical protein
VNFRFTNGIAQISLPGVLEIVADSVEEAEADYLMLLRENGEMTAFEVEGEMELDSRLSCVHRTFRAGES